MFPFPPGSKFLLWTTSSRNWNSINDLAKVTVLRHVMAIYTICTMYNDTRLGLEVSFIMVLTFYWQGQFFYFMSW